MNEIPKPTEQEIKQEALIIEAHAIFREQIALSVQQQIINYKMQILEQRKEAALDRLPFEIAREMIKSYLSPLQLEKLANIKNK